jgi:hypothetical protein
MDRNGRLKFKHAANTMQHEGVHLPNVADAMDGCRMVETIANTRQAFVVFFSACLALMVLPVFFLLGVAKLYGFLDFMALFVFTCSRQPQPQP